MTTLGQDLRYGMRMLARSPGFTVVAVLTLALGIGANTAIFSVVNAVLLRPLPFPDSNQLVQIFETLPAQGVTSAGTSYLNFQDWERQNQAFDAMAAAQQVTVTLTGHGEPQYVPTEAVTSGVFRMMRAHALIGRTLSPEDDLPGANPVVVLSEGLWRERFDADRSLVGRAIALDSESYTVVGILPAGFHFPIAFPAAKLWIPLSHANLFKDLLPLRGGHYLNVFARLKPRVSLSQSQAEMETVQARIAQDHPKTDAGWSARVIPLERQLVGDVQLSLFLLLGAAGFIVLIACANVANLLLARATARARELALRTALGAGRGRILRQLLTESTLLGLSGGLLGLAAADWGVRALKIILPPDLPRIQEVGVDARVLGFSLLLAVVAGIVFGLAAAWQASELNLSETLKVGGHGTGDNRRRRTLRSLLVVTEVALAVVLLAGAGLLIRSFQRLQAVNPGFNPQGLMVLGLELPRQQYPLPAGWARFDQTLLERVRGLPGVQSASAVIPLPLSDSRINLAFHIAGRPEPPPDKLSSAEYSAVDAEYFRVMQIPLLRGRSFGATDAADATKVCVISQAFARTYFPNEDPLGQNLVFGFNDSKAPRRIVGVAADVKVHSLGDPPQPEMYVPYAQDPWFAINVVVRAPNTAGMGAALAAQVHALDLNLPVEEIQPMGSVIHDTVAPERFRTLLLGLFGALALLLAAIGVYGVIAYNVTQQTHEFGIRRALGAEPRDALWLVFRQGMKLAFVGIAAGIVTIVALARPLGSLLYGISALDPFAFVGAVLLLSAVAAGACYVPARRATRVDPMIALRYE
jgi:putative ABC transport system permease protein